MRPTREGVIASAVTAGVAVAAVVTGNNLLYLVGAVALALLLVDLFLAGWNLRGIEVARVLPAELLAGRPAEGRLVLRSRRRASAAWALRLEEEGGAGASVAVDRLGPGRERAVPARWTFPDRGPVALTALVLSSTFPFGAWRAGVRVALPAELVVVPSPEEAPLLRDAGAAGQDGEAPGPGDGLGDFSGLRDYVPGDRPSAVHWPTSARRGTPTAVVRAPDAAERVVVRVADVTGPAWERALSRAAGQVLRACTEGAEVGLELPGVVLEPRAGTAWRRALLEALGRAPRRSS